MTTVEIPADVRDNSPHTVRVVSRGVRAEEGGQSAADLLKHYLDNAQSLGYGGIEYEVTNDGNRAVVNEFWMNGKIVWTFRTEYFTRVKCAECEYRWSQYYMTVTTPDGTSEAVPRCGDHTDLFLKASRGVPGVTVNLSEPLPIGQH